MLKLALTCAAVALSNLAGAQETARWSVGIAATSKLQLIAPFYKVLSNDPGYKLHVGWQANDAWRFELAYQDLGDIKHDFCPQLPNVACARVIDIWSVKQRGVTARAAYSWTLGSIQPYVGLGVGSIVLDTRKSLGNRRASDTDTGLIAEVGVEWRFDSTWSLRTGYEYIGAFSKDGAAQLGLVARF